MLRFDEVPRRSEDDDDDGQVLVLFEGPQESNRAEVAANDVLMCIK